MQSGIVLRRLSNPVRVAGSTHLTVALMKHPAGQAPAAAGAMRDVPGKQSRSKG